MITSIYTGSVKLNKTDKNFKQYLIVSNDTGVLLVEHGLFVLSFDSFKEFKEQTEYENITHIGDVNI